ncbi:MAG: hypothetical protein OEY16_02790 [Alphaproteobacteria bacterium]|nr:hypothetical protein [Alphaproteobacteria bacterium]
MLVDYNVRSSAIMWMRRIACYFIGVTGATGTFVMLLGAFLVVSGVLEW